MDLQQILALFVVAAAAVLLVRRQLRRSRRSTLRPCGHDCGCAAPRASYSEQITYTFVESSAPKQKPSD